MTSPTTEAELIEKQAKAIYEDRNGPLAKPWRAQPTAHKTAYRSDSRAALASLGIPVSDLLAIINGESVVVPVATLEAALSATGELATDRLVKAELRAMIAASQKEKGSE